jgi:ATP-dependent 26S proteasome regulatory subunit
MPRSTSLVSFSWVSRSPANKKDEIDAIGGRRFSEGTSADREIQRTLMELLNQMDGFDYLGQTKLIMVCYKYL